MKRLAFLVVWLLSAPYAAAGDLYLDLRTDYASSDFSWVRVTLIARSDERRSWIHVQSARGDFLRGARIAELSNVDRGDYSLVIELLDGRMRTVHGRLWAFAMGSERHASTLLIVRP